MWKVETTTTSLGLTMLAMAGLTSELTYSKFISSTACQASFRSTKACSSTIRTTRSSVGVNSRPSILAWRPSPPKKLSTSLNTNLASRMNSAVPRSGFIFTRLRLVGTYSECTYSPNFITCTPPTATSAERRSRLNMLMRV